MRWRTARESVTGKRAQRRIRSPFGLLVVAAIVSAGCGAGEVTVEPGSAVAGPSQVVPDLVVDGDRAVKQDDELGTLEGLNETVIGPSETVANDASTDREPSGSTAPASSGSELEPIGEGASPQAKDSPEPEDETDGSDDGESSSAADSFPTTPTNPDDVESGDTDEDRDSAANDRPYDREVVVVTVEPDDDVDGVSSNDLNDDGVASDDVRPSTSISDAPVVDGEGSGDTEPEGPSTTIVEEADGQPEDPTQAASTSTTAPITDPEADKLTSTTTDRGPDPDAEPEPGSVEDVERLFVEELNEVRLDHGLAPFEVDDEMSFASRAWSFEMAKQGDLQHAPDITEGLPTNWELAAENVGVGRSIERLMRAFMDSHDHRVNILNSDYRVLGVGVIMTESGKIYVTHRFAKLSS